MKRADPLGFFNIHSVAKYQKKSQSRKKGKSMSAEKIEREDPSAVEWFCISCWEWMRSKSSTEYMW